MEDACLVSISHYHVPRESFAILSLEVFLLWVLMTLLPRYHNKVPEQFSQPV